MYTETEKAYLAGLFDGEGSIMIVSSTTRKDTGVQRGHVLVVSLSNTHIETMEALHARWGGNWTLRDNMKQMIKPIAVIRWGSSSAISLLRTIEPYVHIKREQLRLALIFTDELESREIPKRSLSHQEWERREDLRMAISNLNGGKRMTKRQPYPELPPRNCLHCGTVYSGYMSRKRMFCTNSCAQAARHARDRLMKAASP